MENHPRIDSPRMFGFGSRGTSTMIYEDPITKIKPEGVAVIREVDEERSTHEFIEARVEFLDEPGQHYYRRIYRK